MSVEVKKYDSAAEAEGICLMALAERMADFVPEPVDVKANWVEQQGGLPSYIKRIVKHLQANGMSESHAIAVAVGVAKRMCATGDLNFPGVQHANPGSRSEACAAVAQWEAMKARAHASSVSPEQKVAVIRLVEVNGREVALVELKAWEEAEHPRDADGRFTDVPGTGIEPLTPWQHLVSLVGHPVNCGDDVNKAAKLLGEGRAVKLNQPSSASTLLDKLYAIVQDAEKKGKKAPNYNLCNVSVKGTNLFCVQSKGVPRVKMPQLAGKPLPGSKADKLPKNADGQVDAGPEFIAYLQDRGIPVYKGHLPAANLRATQDQLNGPKVAGIMEYRRSGGKIPRQIWVSRDNYIIDGHHIWAGDIAFDGEDNRLGDATEEVQKVDVPIPVVLAYAKQFAREYGLPQVGMDDRTSHGHQVNLPESAPKHVVERKLEEHLAYAEKAAGLPVGQGTPFERLQVYLSWVRDQRAEAKTHTVGDIPYANLRFIKTLEELNSAGPNEVITPPRGLGKVVAWFNDHQGDMLDVADGLTHFIGVPGLPHAGSAEPRQAVVRTIELNGREVAVVQLKKYNPDQPRDPGGEGGGRWIKIPGAGAADFLEHQAAKIDSIFLDPYHTTPEKRASPLFVPQPKPKVGQDPAKQPRALIGTQIADKCKRLPDGASHRFPEGTLVRCTGTSGHRNYRVDGPDGTFWRIDEEDVGHLVSFEETTARANRYGDVLPGNQMVPLPGVDVPPSDPIGFQIGGLLHGGYATLPRGTRVHRRIGTAEEGHDTFELTSPTGATAELPSTNKQAIIDQATEFEKQGEGRLGGSTPKPPKWKPTRKAADPNGPLQPLPDTYPDTRIALHAESERVLGYTRFRTSERIGGRPKVALISTPGGFGTPEYTDTDGGKTQWRVEGADRVLTKNGVEIGREPVPGKVDPQAAKQMADFYALNDKVLRQLQKEGIDPGDTMADRYGSPIIWSEHFDQAVELGDEHKGSRAVFGGSPGDIKHPEPYFYVGPQEYEKPSKTWNADGFNGAQLTYAEVLASPNQEKTIHDFYLSHLKALGGQKAVKKFNPGQPRDPGGEHGGEWVKKPGADDLGDFGADLSQNEWAGFGDIGSPDLSRPAGTHLWHITSDPNLAEDWDWKVRGEPTVTGTKLPATNGGYIHLTDPKSAPNWNETWTGGRRYAVEVEILKPSVGREVRSGWHEWRVDGRDTRAVREIPIEDMPKKKFDPKEPRDPHSGEWIGAGGGVTRMFATPARSEREHAESYYATPRWKQFEADVHRQAGDLGVTVDDETLTQGIWSAMPEPSATFTLHGGNPDALAARVGKKWNQDAVLNFTPGDGPDAEYHFRGVGKDHTSLQILKAAESHGLFGATRSGDDIVVVVGPEMGGEDEKALQGFGEDLGASSADRYPGSAHLIEREEYDSLEGKSQEALRAPGLRRDDDDTHREAPEGQAAEEAPEALERKRAHDVSGELRNPHTGEWVKEAGGFLPQEVTATHSWLGKPLRMSRLQRRGKDKTPVMALVTTGNPDMKRYESPALGRLMTPGMYDKASATEADGVPFAADNDGFFGVNTEKYKHMIETFEKQGVHPAWITLPDVLHHHKDGTIKGDASATIRRYPKWKKYLDEHHMNAAFVAQDGMEKPENMKWLEKHIDEVAAVFIAGSDDYKLGPNAVAVADLAHKHGKLVHLGRVNSDMRIAYARDVMHADSFDGSNYAKQKSQNLPGALMFAPTGDAPPTNIGKEWVQQAAEAHNQGKPWPRAPQRKAPQWPRGFYAEKAVEIKGTLYWEPLSEVIYEVGLSERRDLEVKGDSISLTYQLPEQLASFIRLLGMPEPDKDLGGTATWNGIRLSQDDPPYYADTLGKKRVHPTAWINEPRDPGGEHGGQWIKKPSAPSFDQLESPDIPATGPIPTKKAVAAYQAGWSSGINRQLRGVDPTAQPWLTYADSDKQFETIKRLIPALDKAVREGRTVPRHLFRGVDMNEAPGLEAKLHKGNTFTDRGFLSTSGLEQVADNFTGGSQIRQPIVMQITVPEGTHGFDPHGYDMEAESVLPRGGTFKVTSDPHDEHVFGTGLPGISHRVVDVEWSPPKTPPPEPLP